ncbi:MAG: L-gulono,4-lactone dehydrogenase [Thermomicrobiales bacterium]|nr:L-gulono,4-lactone dehydrogenase [Thermomicrobiales bacterium]
MTDRWSTVNDVHSRLNATRVARIVCPKSVAEVRNVVRSAVGRPLAIAGGRHAMGGQQFARGADLLDLTGLADVFAFDAARGEVEAGAGITWPALIGWLHSAQQGTPEPWGIIQKQTGADRLTLGGALSCNAHGRVLDRAPIVADVAAFTLIDADGQVRRCSREENAELFRLVIGGYGLFGPIVSVRLRLAPRRKVRREVALINVDEVVATLEARAAERCRYGDFQFAIDPASDDFLRQGICSVYRPVADETPIPPGQRVLSRADWEALFLLSHTDPRRASDAYTRHYLATDGQIYWSDSHQLADYHDGYHDALDRRLRASHPGSEMISELYVPRHDLPRFMADVAADVRRHGARVIYGTVRLIERDDESFLAWARQPWACVVFNLHVDHTPAGIAGAVAACRLLIDRALDLGGSFYLTYHRWATRRQVETAYPQLPAFLAEKLRHDPEERFQSEWYRHYRELFCLEAPQPGKGG